MTESVDSAGLSSSLHNPNCLGNALKPLSILHIAKLVGVCHERIHILNSGDLSCGEWRLWGESKVWDWLVGSIKDPWHSIDVQRGRTQSALYYRVKVKVCLSWTFQVPWVEWGSEASQGSSVVLPECPPLLGKERQRFHSWGLGRTRRQRRWRGWLRWKWLQQVWSLTQFINVNLFNVILTYPNESVIGK